MYSDCGHKLIADFSDADKVESPIDKWATTGYYVFIGENLVSWKNKKQTMVSRSSDESKHRALTDTTCELVRIQDLLSEL